LIDVFFKVNTVGTVLIVSKAEPETCPVTRGVAPVVLPSVSVKIENWIKLSISVPSLAIHQETK